MNPVRIQLSRKKGWKMPENTVNCSRPGKWGNPFKIGGYFRLGDIDPKAQFRCSWMQRAIWDPDDVKDALKTGFVLVTDAAMAVEMFRKLVTTGYFTGPMLEEIRGKSLACWCKPGTPCHVDVLLEIANEGGAE